MLQGDLPPELDLVLNENAKTFIRDCLRPKASRPSATQLLNDTFLEANGTEDFLPVRGNILERPVMEITAEGGLGNGGEDEEDIVEGEEIESRSNMEGGLAAGRDAGRLLARCHSSPPTYNNAYDQTMSATSSGSGSVAASSLTSAASSRTGTGVASAYNSVKAKGKSDSEGEETAGVPRISRTKSSPLAVAPRPAPEPDRASAPAAGVAPSLAIARDLQPDVTQLVELENESALKSVDGGDSEAMDVDDQGRPFTSGEQGLSRRGSGRVRKVTSAVVLPSRSGTMPSSSSSTDGLESMGTMERVSPAAPVVTATSSTTEPSTLAAGVESAVHSVVSVVDLEDHPEHEESLIFKLYVPFDSDSKEVEFEFDLRQDDPQTIVEEMKCDEELKFLAVYADQIVQSITAVVKVALETLAATAADGARTGVMTAGIKTKRGTSLADVVTQKVRVNYANDASLRNIGIRAQARERMRTSSGADLAMIDISAQSASSFSLKDTVDRTGPEAAPSTSTNATSGHEPTSAVAAPQNVILNTTTQRVPTASVATGAPQESQAPNKQRVLPPVVGGGARDAIPLLNGGSLPAHVLAGAASEQQLIPALITNPAVNRGKSGVSAAPAARRPPVTLNSSGTAASGSSTSRPGTPGCSTGTRKSTGSIAGVAQQMSAILGGAECPSPRNASGGAGANFLMDFSAAAPGHQVGPQNQQPHTSFSFHGTDSPRAVGGLQHFASAPHNSLIHAHQHSSIPSLSSVTSAASSGSVLDTVSSSHLQRSVSGGLLSSHGMHLRSVGSSVADKYFQSYGVTVDACDAYHYDDEIDDEDLLADPEYLEMEAKFQEAVMK